MLAVVAVALSASAGVPAASAPAEAAYPQMYRIRTVDATSLGDLLKRSFPEIGIDVDKGLNVLTVTATARRQKRIVAAIAQVDGPAPGAPAAYDLYTLRAALPGLNGNPSTTAADLAATVAQALAANAPDLHITVSATTPQLIITGNPASVALARELLTRLDVAQKLVVLDTQILEVDETVAKDLGLSFPNPVISTTFSETTPANDANGNPGRIGGIQPITRSPLSLGLQLNLLIRNGTARVLANPRITTVSGRTATIRAGDTIAVQTTAGGGAGTVATTQIQTFQTGVTLDITPIVNGDEVSVTLHPSVNSETAIINGIPQISTRDTQTTVSLHEDQTLIIGGLIQESNSRTTTKIPLLGDLPLIGKIFREHQLSTTRNELIITVTPHIVVPGDGARFTPAPLPSFPPPQPLPTIPPSFRLGTVRAPGPNVTVVQPVAAPSPSAAPFPSLNTFKYGTIPQNNFAKATDPVQIFYATLAPTVLRGNTVVLINVITSSNAQRVTLSYGTFTQQLAEVNRGQWQARFPLGPSVLPPPPANVSFTLSAARSDGSATSIAIPVSIAS
jgi:type II secretory pathway component GspD/PulD (secretin)